MAGRLHGVVLLGRDPAGARALLLSGSVWTNGWIGSSRSAFPRSPSSSSCSGGSRPTGSAASDRSASISSHRWRSRSRRSSGSRCCGKRRGRDRGGIWIYSWVTWVEFFLMLAGVVLTVAAPFIPPFVRGLRGPPRGRRSPQRPSDPSRLAAAAPDRAARPWRRSGADAGEPCATGAFALSPTTPSRRRRAAPLRRPRPDAVDRWAPTAGARHVRAGATAEPRLGCASSRSGRSLPRSATSWTSAASRSSASVRPRGRW